MLTESGITPACLCSLTLSAAFHGSVVWMQAQKIEETEGREAKWHGLPAHGPALDLRIPNKSRLLWDVRILSGETSQDFRRLP